MDKPTRVITTRAVGKGVRVRFGGETIAETSRALELFEETHDPVLYVPKADVRMDLLVASDSTTHCPFKGDARYWSIRAGGSEATDAVWAYDTPLASVAQIADHVAFYADRVDAIEVGQNHRPIQKEEPVR